MVVRRLHSNSIHPQQNRHPIALAVHFQCLNHVGPALRKRYRANDTDRDRVMHTQIRVANVKSGIHLENELSSDATSGKTIRKIQLLIKGTSGDCLHKNANHI